MGWEGREARKCFSRLAESLAEKRNEDYSVTMSWIRIKISFSMMKSILMCVRGSRSVRNEEHNMNELASYSESRCAITN